MSSPYFGGAEPLKRQYKLKYDEQACDALGLPLVYKHEKIFA